MAYESIAAYVDKIEVLLTKGLSPRAIASQLGIPEKWRTIHRYKKEVFDFKKAAAEDWTQEKQKGHEERFREGKQRIIDNFEFLNRLKIKADELLDFNVGDTYETETVDGPTTSKLTPILIAKIRGEASRIGTAAIKAEQELAGDTAEDRKADALTSLSDAQLRAIVEATAETPAKGPE